MAFLFGTEEAALFVDYSGSTLPFDAGHDDHPQSNRLRHGALLSLMLWCTVPHRHNAVVLPSGYYWHHNSRLGVPYFQCTAEWPTTEGVCVQTPRTMLYR